MSVVLPAPFSPRRQWTSPSSRVRSTSSLATSGPNALVMPASSSLMAPRRSLSCYLTTFPWSGSGAPFPVPAGPWPATVRAGGRALH